MKYLINPNKTQYKANLHCHTNLSDGHWTPEQVKEEYKKRGYSVVAITDHERLEPDRLQRTYRDQEQGWIQSLQLPYNPYK